MQCNSTIRATSFLRRSLFGGDGAPIFWRGFQPGRLLRRPLRARGMQIDCSAPIEKHSVFLGASLANARMSTSQPSPSFEPSPSSTTPSPPGTSDPKPDTPSSPMTPAQMSRAAARAVRLCTRNGAIAEALYILNSLHRSVEEGDGKASAGPLEENIPVPEGMQPIKFNRPVSPRLSNHCFLHAMIRAGNIGRAARLAEKMMARGTPLRTTTLHRIMAALCNSPQANIKATARNFVLTTIRRLESSDVLNIRLGDLADPCTRAAFHILKHAHTFGHRRSENMYNSLIQACLRQGEIIVASLLLVLLLKDLQRARAQEAVLAAKTDADTSPSAQSPMLTRHGWKPGETLRPILRSIEDTMAENPTDDAGEVKLRMALQALANLTMLLTEGPAVRISQLPQLIRTLYSVPRTNIKVWVWEDGEPRQVEAYTWFHHILWRMVQSLRPDCDAKLHFLPPSGRVCNTLLHYSLRHRLSPDMASIVLTHMVERPRSRLKPDVVTYNILIRSATILRQNQTADILLEYLLKAQQITTSGEGTVPEKDDCPKALQPLEAGQIMPALKALKKERLLIEPLITRTDPDLNPDDYTLTSYIAHLTATGRPALVADVVFQLLPELKYGYDSTQDKESQKRSRQECLQKAIGFGPVVLTAILNALVKAEEIRLAERVWMLALQAQMVSWVPELRPGDAEPWCLPVLAYTVMMQAYAKKSRRHIALASRAQREGIDAPSKENVGMKKGWMLLRSFASGGQTLEGSLAHVKKYAANFEIPPDALPVPDARFFNVALDLFGFQLRVSSKTVNKASRSRTRRGVQYAINLYQRSGVPSKWWQPGLQEVVTMMTQRGHPIPLGIRKFLVGRWNVVDLIQEKEIRELVRVPYAYPAKRQFRAFSLPVLKTKGLPLRRGKRNIRRWTKAVAAKPSAV